MKNNAWVKAQDMGPGPLAFADMVFTGSRAILFGDFEIVNNKYVLSHGTWDCERCSVAHRWLAPQCGSCGQTWSLNGI